jgi:hypothetical protein
MERYYSIRISPEVITNDLFLAPYNAGSNVIQIPGNPCCDISPSSTTVNYSGLTYVYSSMTDILSGGTNGSSILTGLTIPIFLNQTAIDIGYYSVFDGFVIQQQTMTNFVFSGDINNPYECYFYNTSNREFKKYLSFSDYKIDWGDGTPQETVNGLSPNYYSHTYAQDGQFKIVMSGMSPWGTNVVEKTVNLPFTGITIDNPNGTAYFTPLGGSWSGTSLMYDYLFTGDSICDIELQTDYQYTSVPFLVTGYTKSSVNDLTQYGSKYNLYAGKFKIGVPVTGTSGSVGIFHGPSIDNVYTAYTINDIDYYDYSDGTTVFAVYSSGITADMLICSAITKEEVLINVIDAPEIQSNVFIERGKNSALERLQRLNEVDNAGDLNKYGYGFFNVIKI